MLASWDIGVTCQIFDVKSYSREALRLSDHAICEELRLRVSITWPLYTNERFNALVSVIDNHWPPTLSNHDWMTISRLSPIMALSFVHKSNNIVSGEDLTHEIFTDHTNGTHQLVISTYSSVPSILTSVMLSCGNDVVTANDAGAINDVCCGCGAISSGKMGVSGTISSGRGCSMYHGILETSTIFSIDSSDHVAITISHDPCSAPDHVSDIVSSSNDEVISLPDWFSWSISRSCDIHHVWLSDILSICDDANISCSELISFHLSSSHDHDRVSVISSAMTIFTIVWHNKRIHDIMTIPVCHSLTIYDKL